MEKSQPDPDAEQRKHETLLFIPWALGTVLFSIYVPASRLFLIYRYGWAKVQQEHLTILQMPKGKPWPISNGDLIKDGQFIHFLISIVCWLLLFFSTYPFLRRLLPRQDETQK